MESESSKVPASSMRSLERAIDVLEVLDESRHPLRLSDVARRAGLPVATTQRILNVLEARGRVERDPAGYRPGVGLIFGAHAYLTSSPLVLAARPILQELAAETGFTASLFRRVGPHRVVLARVEGERPLRYEIPIGERLPLHLGAGKAVCATLPIDELDLVLKALPDVVRADGSVRTREEFLAELATIRVRGFSTAVNERIPGLTSVAAAVQAGDAPVTAALQVTAAAGEIEEGRFDSLGVEVQRAAFGVARSVF